MKIPRLIHQIWLGKREMPPIMLEWRQKWIDLHPGWTCLLWNDFNLSSTLYCIKIGHFIVPSPANQWAIEKAANVSQRTNIWRYHIINWLGGLYVDTDVEPLKPIDPLIENLEAFTSARTNNPSVYECALMGATPQHSWLDDLVKNIHTQDPSVSFSLGVEYFTPITKVHAEVSLLPDKAFLSNCPSQWLTSGGPPYVGTNRGTLTEDTYAIHHWSHRWFSGGLEPLQSSPSRG